VSTGIFMVGLLFSGSLEADERLSMYWIRSRPHLGGVGFRILIGVPLIYDAFVYVAPHFGSLSVLCGNLIINNIICR
jgi:hypothetical protein